MWPEEMLSHSRYSTSKNSGYADILVAVSKNKAVTRPLRCVAVARVCLLGAVCICKGLAYD